MISASPASTPESPQFRHGVAPPMQELKINEDPATVPMLKDTAEAIHTDAVVAVDTTEEYRTTAWRRKLQENVYDRQEEQALLNVHFQKTLKKHDTAMFLLISGAVGTGKTRLAKTLKEPVETQGGYFLTGKFDQLCRPEPYVSSFCRAVDLIPFNDALTSSSIVHTFRQHFVWRLQNSPHWW
jgi:hypothetical protein